MTLQQPALTGQVLNPAGIFHAWEMKKNEYVIVKAFFFMDGFFCFL